MMSKYGATMRAALASASVSEPKSCTDSGLSSSEYSRNSRMVRPSRLSEWCLTTMLCMLVNSVTTKAAPRLRAISLRAGSLTPAMGAKNARPSK